MLEKKSYTWPTIQAGASLLSVCGNIAGLCLSENNRVSPFFYTALVNSALYTVANTMETYKVYQHNSFVERELQRQNVIRNMEAGL